MAGPRLDTPLKMTIGVTEACPFRCRHCYADCASSPKPGEIPAERWISVLDALAERGVIHVYFEGGEPFLKPGFLDVLRSTTEQMMTMVRTHGWRLSRPLADELAAIGVGRVFVDLMGADAETHDAASGVPGSFAEACDAVRNLAEAGVPADVVCIMTRQTAPQLHRMAHLARQLGAERIGVLRLYPLGRARAEWARLSLTLSQQMAALAAIDPPAGLGVMQSWHPNDHNCCWQAAAINAFGRAIGCMYLREYVDFGDAIATPYDEIFRANRLYRQLRSGAVDESCTSCASTQGSHGGCRSAAYAWHGSWTAPDPFDLPLNHGVNLTLLPPERARAHDLDA